MEQKPGLHLVEIVDRTGEVVMKCHVEGCGWEASIRMTSENGMLAPLDDSRYVHIRRQAMNLADSHRWASPLPSKAKR